VHPMSMHVSMLEARAEYYCSDHDFGRYLGYSRLHEFDFSNLSSFAGATAVMRVVDCGRNRFEFSHCFPHQPNFPAFVCEALDKDGETAIDLVAWPLCQPRRVLTMFGRCGILGAWEALNPTRYTFDAPLIVHRTPLDWLKAGCTGAAIVTGNIATRMLLDLPGKLAAQDERHGREIEALRRSVLPKNQVLVPSQIRRVSA